MSERVSIEERYGNAVDATDLKLRFERRGAVDVLTAAGLVGIHKPLSMSLWRWIYGQDASERISVISGLIGWMKRQAINRHWSKTNDMVVVTMLVADWYADKICRTCNGTRYTIIEGTPTLSDVPCPVCHGTGERSLDKMLFAHGPDWIKRGKDLRAHMDECMRQASELMLKKMANTIKESGL